MSRRVFGGDVWCLIGDFNAVGDVHERRGIGGEESSVDALECSEYRGFIEDMHLIDLPLEEVYLVTTEWAYHDSTRSDYSLIGVDACLG